MDAIKDAVRENLLQLVNRNMITQSKMGDVVHKMQELSNAEEYRKTSPSNTPATYEIGLLSRQLWLP